MVSICKAFKAFTFSIYSIVDCIIYLCVAKLHPIKVSVLVECGI